MTRPPSRTGTYRPLMFAAALALGLASPTRAVSAQEVARDAGRASVGDTVQLFAGRVLVVRGTLADADSAGLLVIPANGAERVRYLFDQFDRASVRRGHRRRGAHSLVKGFAIGTGIGAGIVLLAATTQSPHDEGLGVIVGIMAGMVSSGVGTVAGGLMGFTYTDIWLRFDPRTLAVQPDAG